MEGIDNFKVHFTQRNHHPLAAPDFDHLHGGYVVIPTPFSETALIIGDRGKKRFEAPVSKPYEHRLSKRLLPHPEPKDYNNRGLKLIPAMKSSASEAAIPGKRHIKEGSMRRSESSELPVINWTRKGRVFTEDGVPAALRESDVYNLEAR